MPDWTRALQQTIADSPKLVITASLTTIAGAVTAACWNRIINFVKRRWRVDVGPKTLHTLPGWPAETIARTFSASILRDGFPIAGGTEILVLDRDQVQFSLRAGEGGTSEIRARMRKHGVTGAARALQVLTMPVDIGVRLAGIAAGGAAIASVLVQVKVDMSRAALLAEWHLSRDLTVNQADVARTIASALQPVFASRLGSCDAASLSDAFLRIRPEVQSTLDQELESHGLVPALRSCEVCAAGSGW